jgi:hypothetical protein
VRSAAQDSPKHYSLLQRYNTAPLIATIKTTCDADYHCRTAVDAYGTGGNITRNLALSYHVYSCG